MYCNTCTGRTTVTYIFLHRRQYQTLNFIQALVYLRPSLFFHDWLMTLKHFTYTASCLSTQKVICYLKILNFQILRSRLCLFLFMSNL